MASAVGLDTLYGTGNGLAVTTNANGNVFGLTNSVAPGGTYTFTGSGGKDIGSFQVTLNVPPPTLNVTNQAALASVTRSRGATVTWSGGFANGFVQVTGSGGAPAVKFFCYAPTSAGQLTVPPSILLAVPPGPGSINFTDATPFQTISASGLDVGLAAGADNNGQKIGTTFK